MPFKNKRMTRKSISEKGMSSILDVNLRPSSKDFDQTVKWSFWE